MFFLSLGTMSSVGAAVMARVGHCYRMLESWQRWHKRLGGFLAPRSAVPAWRTDDEEPSDAVLSAWGDASTLWPARLVSRLRPSGAAIDVEVAVDFAVVMDRNDVRIV